MNYNYHIVAQMIGILRVQKNMTQKELASKAGLARSHYAMIENGTKCASVETLWKIAEALGIRLSDLFRMIEDQTENNPNSE